MGDTFLYKWETLAHIYDEYKPASESLKVYPHGNYAAFEAEDPSVPLCFTRDDIFLGWVPNICHPVSNIRNPNLQPVTFKI